MIIQNGYIIVETKYKIVIRITNLSKVYILKINIENQ